jgi:glycogen operon protein
MRLCLFDRAGVEIQLDMEATGAGYWQLDVPGMLPGQEYGFRAEGPWDPHQGLRVNPHKLLLDPYAKAIRGEPRWGSPLLPPVAGGDGSVMDEQDSAPHMPRAVVIDDAFDWADDARPNHAWNDTVIYEAHVKGLTAAHPSVPEHARGRYAGAAHPEIIRHLQHLGVTAVEFLPVHAFAHEPRLVENGLVNYWGYNTFGFFAPHAAYAAATDPLDVVREFKSMVKGLHAAGIEVILDVVFNHTAEGNHLGPVLSFKGLDNAAYYRLSADPMFYDDVTGTGNAINAGHPVVNELVLDSLRYWVTDMHVDGFRFDLASTLARSGDALDPHAGLTARIASDPILAGVKLIAEPWDVGPGGYALGRFPPPWREWNDQYRGAVRDFWRGAGSASDLARRISGSSDIFAEQPSRSLNFVTAHDGFTLRDLVSYNEKHNEANLEHNADGSNDNRSWNCGVEGPSADPGVEALRARQQRNLLGTLLASTGVPMIVAGDELGRTQRGNNNAYCHDGVEWWIDWEHADHALADYVRRVALCRRAHSAALGRGAPTWLSAAAAPLSDEDWHDGGPRVLLVAWDLDEQPFLIAINGTHDAADITLPELSGGGAWRDALDDTGSCASRCHLEALSLRLFERSADRSE